MSDVAARADDVRKLASALQRYQQDVKQASRTVEGALRSANWKDRKKEQFEIRFRDFQKQMDRFMSAEVTDMVRSLNELARKIDEITRMRM